MTLWEKIDANLSFNEVPDEDLLLKSLSQNATWLVHLLLCSIR